MISENGYKTTLRVEDLYNEFKGKNIVCISPDFIENYDLKSGGIVEISSQHTGKKTSATLFFSKPEDSGANSIRMDFFLRRNLGINVGDKVHIKKIDIQNAEHVIFTGALRPIKLKNSQHLAKKLTNRLITKGDILSFHNNKIRIDLIVLNHSPWAPAVKISDKTKIFVVNS
jgi:hypothetical protein